MVPRGLEHQVQFPEVLERRIAAHGLLCRSRSASSRSSRTLWATARADTKPLTWRLATLDFHTGNKPLVKDKKKPKKKPPPPRQPSKESSKENNGAKDGATASETKKGKGGATGAKDAAAASKTKKGKK